MSRVVVYGQAGVLLRSVLDAAKAEVGALKDLEERTRKRFVHGSAGLKLLLDIIKEGDEELKTKAMDMLKEIRANSSAIGPTILLERNEVKMGIQVDNKVLEGIAATATSFPANPIAAEQDKKLQNVIVTIKAVLWLREEVLQFGGSIDSAKSDAAQKSLLAMASLVKEYGSVAQKERMLKLKGIEPESQPNEAVEEKVGKWLSVLQKYEKVEPPDPAGAAKLDALDGEMLDGVSFATSFDPGETTAATTASINSQTPSSNRVKSRQSSVCTEETPVEQKKIERPKKEEIVVRDEEEEGEGEEGEKETKKSGAGKALAFIGNLLNRRNTSSSSPNSKPGSASNSPTVARKATVAVPASDVNKEKSSPAPVRKRSASNSAMRSGNVISSNNNNSNSSLESQAEFMKPEKVLRLSKLRIQIGRAVFTHFKTNRCKARIVLKIGSEKYSTLPVECNIPGVADLEDQFINLPYDFTGQRVSIDVLAKPMAETKDVKSPNASKIDRISSKVNVLGKPEELIGSTTQIPIGSITIGTFATAISFISTNNTNNNSNNASSPSVFDSPKMLLRKLSRKDLKKDVIAATASVVEEEPVEQDNGVFTATTEIVERESQTLVARDMIAPRKLVHECGLLRSAETFANLSNKILELQVFRGKKAPSKYVPVVSSGDELLDRLNAWPCESTGVCRVVKSGYRANGKVANWCGQTPLHYAVLAADPIAIQIIERFGLEDDPNETVDMKIENLKHKKKKVAFFNADDRDQMGLSPWFYSIMFREIKCVKEFVAWDPNIVHTTLDSLHALHIACFLGDEELVRYLVEDLSCNMDMKDQNSATPIFYACNNNHLSVVQYLVGRGAYFRVEDVDLQSPLMVALARQHVDLAKFLVASNADWNTFNLLGENPVCEQYDPKVVLGRYRNSILHKLILFVENEQVGCLMMSVILSHHPSCVHVENEQKKTPLFYACALSRPKMVTLLLNSGADPKATDVFENTPLHFAFLPSIIAALVERGAKVDASNQEGNTPLHVMSSFGFRDAVSSLWAFGANNLCNARGIRPSDMFCENPSDQVYIALPFFEDDIAASKTGGLVLLETEEKDKGEISVHRAKLQARRASRKIVQVVKGVMDDVNNTLEHYDERRVK